MCRFLVSKTIWDIIKNIDCFSVIDHNLRPSDDFVFKLEVNSLFNIYKERGTISTIIRHTDSPSERFLPIICLILILILPLQWFHVCISSRVSLLILSTLQYPKIFFLVITTFMFVVVNRYYLYERPADRNVLNTKF